MKDYEENRKDTAGQEFSYYIIMLLHEVDDTKLNTTIFPEIIIIKWERNYCWRENYNEKRICKRMDQLSWDEEVYY